MSRQSTHKINLTLNELEWVTRAVNRIAARLVTVGETTEVTKSEREALVKLNDKLTDMPQPELNGEFVLDASRVQLRMIQRIAKNEHAALVTQVIPGYAQKMETDKERYTQYYSSSVKRSEMLLVLVNKITLRL